MKQFKAAKTAKREAQLFAKEFTVSCIAAIMPTGRYRIFVFRHGSQQLVQSGPADSLQNDLSEILQNFPDAEVMEFELLRGDFWLGGVIA